MAAQHNGNNDFVSLARQSRHAIPLTSAPPAEADAPPPADAEAPPPADADAPLPADAEAPPPLLLALADESLSELDEDESSEELSEDEEASVPDSSTLEA